MNSEQQHGFGVYSADSGNALDLAMQELWLSGTVFCAGARLTVRHVFRSGETEPIEVIYAFGLPADAALRRFRVVGEGFNVESALKPVEKARADYEEGMEEGHLSTLAQVYKDGMVNLNLGNIRPGETVTVLLELAAGVSAADDGFRFRFPFTLAPKYHARATAAISDSGEGEMALPEDVFGDVALPHWRENGDGLHRVGFELDLLLPDSGAEIASPSHAIAARMTGASTAKVRLALEGDVPDRDLILDASCALKTPQAFTGRDGEGKGRFIAVVPSHCFGAPPEKAPRKILFIVDSSGSMSGKPFEQAQRALRACIDTLAPEDRFNIVYFGSDAYFYQPDLVAADVEQRDLANHFISKMRAGGGTEFSAAIRTAALLMPEGGDALLLSDGGVFGHNELLKQARESGLRFHCLGIGSSGEDRFFTQLARKTGGIVRTISTRENAGNAALAMLQSCETSIADQLDFAVTGLSGAALTPAPAARVYAGHPVILFGACDNGDTGTIECRWSGGRLDIDLSITDDNIGKTLKLIQGARITADLETNMANFEDDPGLEAQLVRIAREYELANTAMALVAVVKRADDQPGALPKTRIVSVGMPQDVAFHSLFPTSPACMRGEIAENVDHRVMSQRIPDLWMRHKRSYRSEAFSECCDAPIPYSVQAEKCSADSASHVDIFFATCDKLQMDGGLPGDVMDTRITRTLALFLIMRSCMQAGPDSRLSVERMRCLPFVRAMLQFLRNRTDHTLSPERVNLLHHILGPSGSCVMAELQNENAIPDFDLLTADDETVWAWISDAVGVVS